MANSTIKDTLQNAHTLGWTVTRTKGKHYKLEHPNATRAVIAPSTPSDHRSILNLQAELRRVMPRHLGAEETKKTHAPARRRKGSKRAASENFDMLPLIRERIASASKRRLLQSKSKAADLDVSHAEPEKNSASEIISAWGLMILRVRLAGADWSVIKSLKRRLNSDHEFRLKVIQSGRETDAETAAAMRRGLREGVGIATWSKLNAPQRRIIGRFPQFSAPQVVNVTPVPQLQPVNLDERVEALETELAETNSRALKAEARIVELLAELAESKTRRAYAEFARDRAEESLAEMREAKKLSNKLNAGIETKPIQAHLVSGQSQNHNPIFTERKSMQTLPIISVKPVTPSPAASEESKGTSKQTLKALRISAGLTQTALGSKIGTSGAMICLFESNRHKIQPDRVEVIANALGVEASVVEAIRLAALEAPNPTKAKNNPKSSTPENTTSNARPKSPSHQVLLGNSQRAVLSSPARCTESNPT